MSEIVNKVKESGLIQLDLAAFKPRLPIQEIDLASNLWQGLILKEKDFRTWIKEHDWDHYKDSLVFIHCSADAIIPVWAYMLVSSQLNDRGIFNVVGNKDELLKQAIIHSIQQVDLSEYRDGRIIIKGCSDIPFPAFAMTELVKYLQPVAKSIMFGEPCSTVPVFKRKS